MAGFLLVCALEGVAGWLLWRGQMGRGVLALALIPAGAVYWWGFALPFPPIFDIVRTILILLSLKSLV